MVFILLPPFFPSPEFVHFFLKSFCKRPIIGKFNRLLIAHEVTVMAIRTVVVAGHSPVVHPADQVIDIRGIVLRHFAIRRLPHFFPQSGAAPGPLQDERVVDGFFLRNGRFTPFSRQLPSLPQMGH